MELGIGIMSGTSVDGLDIAACSFTENDKKINFKIHKTQNINYSNDLKNTLLNAHLLNAYELISLNNTYGVFIGNCIKKFIDSNNLKNLKYIGSHGHTVFHKPDEMISYQIGSGASIASVTGIDTVCDFRSTDIALKGQGAPLVPIGDELLFGEYDACLNLGGFSNISFRENNKRIAYDICPVNIALNYYARKLNMEFDKDGQMAKKGNVNKNLLEELKNIEYYNLNYPKSLSREWFEIIFLPIINKYKNLNNIDILNTLTIHIAEKLAVAIKNKKNVIITGGGAHNNFLIDKLKEISKTKIIIPSNDLIEYKEALIFAFLAYLRLKGRTNSLASSTGAIKDSCSGAVYKA